jgi:hypothetical protein
MPASSVRKAATTIRELPTAAAMTLINRDYHPGNTVRSRRRLTAIADWAQASSAPPDPDAGHMRWNLAADNGQQATGRHPGCYRKRPRRQPYRDLVSPLPDIGAPGDIMQPACSASRTTPAHCLRHEPLWPAPTHRPASRPCGHGERA